MPGKVLKLEVIARVGQLRSHKDGARWDIELLEVIEASDE
jgi:hypothetical protein